MQAPSVESRRSPGMMAFLLLLAVSAAVLAANALLSEVQPGNAWSLGYGIAAAVLLLVAAAMGIRRRTARLASRLGAGRASAWLSIHLWGGGLFLVLVMMHSSFSLPSGWLTWGLWGLSVWTVASGIVGRLLQRWIPRLLSSGLSTEVLYERIPELVEEIRQRASELATHCGEEVGALYERAVAPALERPRWRGIYFIDITGGIHSRLREFEYLRRVLPEEEQERLAELERLLKTKLEIDAHFTLQQVLRQWLWVHLPPSILLIALLLLHLLTVLYY